MMFGQVQRAFRAGITQTDVLEGGRAAADMLSRELSGVIPSYIGATNFYYGPTNITSAQLLPGGGTTSRANVLERLYFLTRENQDWVGYGYRVYDPSGLGVGELQRYTPTNVNRTPWIQPNYLAPATDPTWHRVLDGVVHFQVRALNSTNEIARTNAVSIFSSGGICIFRSNAVPAYVEFELGILEKRAYERFRALTNNPVAAASYLQNQAGKVHLFRQRVPIRTVDVKAYQ